jgi:ATP-dependent HslUV protease ATP-binding subunit HslU
MLAELQGRLPIRVELKGLTADDLYRILTEPKANLLEQQCALLGAEGVKLEFDDDAVRELANRAAEINQSVENIGARRLHTVLERVMDEVSFEAARMEPGTEFRVTKALVEERMSALDKRADLTRFII